jgi:hypothetical protein
LGRTVFIRDGQNVKSPAQVIGLVRDSKYSSVWEPPEPHIYLAALQSGFPVVRLLVRTYGGTDATMSAIRYRWDEWAPHIPLYDVRTGEELVNLSLAPNGWQRNSWLRLGWWRSSWRLWAFIV